MFFWARSIFDRVVVGFWPGCGNSLAVSINVVARGAQRKMGQKRRGIGRIETISPALTGGSNGGLTIKASAWASVAIIELS